MGDRYLQLEYYPDPDWNHFFNEVYSNYLSTNKRHARIEGDHLVVRCMLDEIQNQIRALQEPLLQATKRFDDYKNELRLQVEAQEAALKEQEDKANDVFNNLKF